MKEKIIRLIELTAERETLAIKAEYLKEKRNADEADALFKRIKALDDEISLISNLLKSKGVDFYLIGFEQLLATERINAAPLSERLKAIEYREGELFELIKKRFSILKENLDAKNELAKALVLISSLKDSAAKPELLGAIKSKQKIDVETSDDAKVNAIHTIFSRLGLCDFSEEKRFVIQRDVVWLKGGDAQKMDGVMEGLKALEPELQWKNAQRQIKRFTDAEEEEFADIQKKYLNLLNMRDELVEQYKKKEEAIVTV